MSKYFKARERMALTRSDLMIGCRLDIRYNTNYIEYLDTDSIHIALEVLIQEL